MNESTYITNKTKPPVYIKVHRVKFSLVTLHTCGTCTEYMYVLKVIWLITVSHFFRLRCVPILLTLTNSDNRYLTKHTYRMFAQGMHLKAYSQVVGIGAHRIFSRGGQIRGSGDESPPAGSRGGALVGVWGEAPRSRRKIVKIMHT